MTQFSVPVQRLLAEMDRSLAVSDVLTMDQVLGRNTLEASFDATVLMVFAGLSLLLAAVGLFGVLSYIVAQRRTEIGIRLALGVRRGQVLRRTLVDGLLPALIGLLLGIAASASTVRLIRSMLYGTQPVDLAVFAAVSASLLAVAAQCPPGEPPASIRWKRCGRNSLQRSMIRTSSVGQIFAWLVYCPPIGRKSM